MNLITRPLVRTAAQAARPDRSSGARRARNWRHNRPNSPYNLARIRWEREWEEKALRDKLAVALLATVAVAVVAVKLLQ
jgi:hypothetical protein